MATRPTNDLLVWANTDVNLPNLTGPNKTEPSADLVAKGWDFKQKPSADEFNYILNNLGEWVEYLKTLTAEGTPLNTPSTLVERDVSGNFAASMITSNLTGDVTGNADTATKWQTARTLTLTGDASGSVNIDGSGNVTLSVAVADNSHNHTSDNISDATSANNANKIVKRGASGEISVGGVTVNKVSNESTIIFPATVNDSGFITHSETDDVARMKFSISDNNYTSDAFQFGNTEGGSFTPTFTITSSGIATGSNGQLHSVSVLTGTISHGGTIPLPSGYTEAQCKWLVSIDNSNSNGTTWDWRAAVYANQIFQTCRTTGRVVTATTTVMDEVGSITFPATANYMIIGIK